MIKMLQLLGMPNLERGYNWSSAVVTVAFRQQFYEARTGPSYIQYTRSKGHQFKFFLDLNLNLDLNLDNRSFILAIF